MSAYDRMRQVKELLSNTSSLSLQLTNRINFNQISQLINQSKTKVTSLLNNHQHNQYATSSFEKRSNTKADLVLVLDLNAEKKLNSMTNLTNFVLYDDIDSSSPYQNAERSVCLFDLSELDQDQVKYFASEIDEIETELTDLTSHIKSIKTAYKTYYESFLNLCDRKDELFELFLDYYEEYFLNTEEKLSMSKLAKKAKLNSKSLQKELKTRKSCLKESSNSDEDDDCHMDMEKSRNYKSKILRRKSSIYIYSVPTENRFSILSKSDTGTLIKHY
jgi:predicted HTH domain antitoxin